MALIDNVKTALRLKTNAFDGEIQSLIDAAKIDMQLSGVYADKDDPMISQAVILYCKALFGLGNPDKERYWASYRGMVCHMALSSEYGMHEGERP